MKIGFGVKNIMLIGLILLFLAIARNFQQVSYEIKPLEIPKDQPPVVISPLGNPFVTEEDVKPQPQVLGTSTSEEQQEAKPAVSPDGCKNITHLTTNTPPRGFEFGTNEICE